MASILDFPGRAPAKPCGLVATDRAALDLLSALRAVEPDVPGESCAERELAVFSRAVQRLSAVSPVEDLPDADDAAKVEQALILAQLAGHLLSELDERRKCRAIPLAVAALAEATHPA